MFALVRKVFKFNNYGKFVKFGSHKKTGNFKF